MPIPGMLIVILKWVAGWWKLWCINKLYLLLYWNGSLDDESCEASINCTCRYTEMGCWMMTACSPPTCTMGVISSPRVPCRIQLRVVPTRIMAPLPWLNMRTGPYSSGTWQKQKSWWRHQMGTFPRYCPFVRGIQRSLVNSLHKGQSRNFDVFFDLRLNKWLSKQSRGWLFEMPSCSLWRCYNGKMMQLGMQYHRWACINKFLRSNNKPSICTSLGQVYH